VRTQRTRTILALLALVLGGSLATTPRPAAAQAEQCFPETGFCVQGRFWDYWEQNGGLAGNGFPLTDERREILEDGNEYTVQYSERVRMEYHPENPAPYDVLLGQFGRRVSGIYMTDPSKPQPGRVFFPETGHNLFARFLEYWQENGGLARFGYPISEEYGQRLEDGQSYTVQYFERARFEYHPENPRPYDVLLGQFGRRILAENDVLGVPERAGFGILYITNEDVRQRVGRFAPPTERAIEAPGAYQAFEHGALLWRGDLRRIYVFCGDPTRGTMLRPTVFVPGDPLGETLGGASFPDTWDPSQPPGGGPGPQPGLYEPAHGFGKLWREDARVRDCLGYATDAAETAYTLRMQPFPVSAMFSATTPQGRFIYVVVWSGWNHPSSCAAAPELCRPDYTRYPDPGR